MENVSYTEYKELIEQDLLVAGSSTCGIPVSEEWFNTELDSFETYNPNYSLPPTIIYYLLKKKLVDDGSLKEYILSTILKPALVTSRLGETTVYNDVAPYGEILYMIFTFSKVMNQDNLVMNTLRNQIDFISTWFIPPEMEYFREDVKIFNYYNPNSKIIPRFGCISEKYVRLQEVFIHFMWITQVKDMSYELEEPFKCNFRQRELNYYRYLVYMLENGKAYELFNYSSPFTFVEYYPQFRDREWIHSYQFDGLLNIYVLNFLSFVKEHAPEIEIWKEQFYALYEMEETLPEYCNWLIAHLLSLAIYPSRCEKPFIDENRMVNFIRKSKDNFLGSKKYSEELKKLLIEKIKSINKHSLKHHIYLK